jgi:hypothetical protein
MERIRKRKGSVRLQKHFRIVRKYIIESFSLAKFYKNEEND